MLKSSIYKGTRIESIDWIEFLTQFAMVFSVALFDSI